MSPGIRDDDNVQHTFVLTKIYSCSYMLNLSIAKFSEVSPRNLAECLREIAQSFSANFRGVSPRIFAVKILGEISEFYFSPRKKIISRKGSSAAKREKKKSFFLGLICMFLTA